MIVTVKNANPSIFFPFTKYNYDDSIETLRSYTRTSKLTKNGKIFVVWAVV